ncbi:MAG: transporter substrate-binding domain-containing protein [Rubrivivax sp.]|nr:transporter substrate-binding domain-containing protein [Rubrivivax sp.]
MKAPKMIRWLTTLCLAGMGMALVGSPALAAGKNWKVSLAQMPGYAESTDKGVLVDLVKALEKVSGDKVELQVVPFSRSMTDVQGKKVDLHMPLIQLPGSETGTPKFDYSKETIFHVNFALYSNKSVDVSPATASKFKVETDQAHVDYFDFPIVASSNIESSLKKVNAGRVDGFIFADVASDPIVKAAALTNIKRQLYKRFDVKVVLPKGERGGAADKWLTENIGKLRASGEYNRIMGMIDTPFQP